MKAFNCKRFVEVFKWDLADSQRTIVRTFAIWLVVFGFNIFLNYFRLFGAGTNTTYPSQSILGFFFIAFFFLLTITPSLLLVKVNKNRQQRLSYLMLPGTSLEKYLVRLVVVFLTYLVTFVVAFVVADLVQYVVSLIANPSVAKLAMSHLFFDRTVTIVFGEGAMTGFIAFMAITLWNLTFYLLGGTFFRKQAWLLVSLTLLLLLILFKIFLGDIANLFIDMHFITRNADTINTIIATVFGLLTVLNICLSFHLFKRLQLINNKWINI